MQIEDIQTVDRGTLNETCSRLSFSVTVQMDRLQYVYCECSCRMCAFEQKHQINVRNDCPKYTCVM